MISEGEGFFSGKLGFSCQTVVNTAVAFPLPYPVSPQLPAPWAGSAPNSYPSLRSSLQPSRPPPQPASVPSPRNHPQPLARGKIEIIAIDHISSCICKFAPSRLLAFGPTHCSAPASSLSCQLVPLSTRTN